MQERPEQLISQRDLRAMLGNVTDMTVWRWRKNGTLPAPIVINKRNYYRASEIAAMQARLASQSAAQSGEAA